MLHRATGPNPQPATIHHQSTQHAGSEQRAPRPRPADARTELTQRQPFSGAPLRDRSPTSRFRALRHATGVANQNPLTATLTATGAHRGTRRVRFNRIAPTRVSSLTSAPFTDERRRRTLSKFRVTVKLSAALRKAMTTIFSEKRNDNVIPSVPLVNIQRLPCSNRTEGHISRIVIWIN